MIFTRDILGTKKHLLKTECGFKWVKEVPNNVWVLGQPGRHQDLAELAHAMGTSLEWKIPQAQVQSFQELLGEDADLSRVRWDLVLPRATFLKQVSSLQNQAEEVLKNLSEWKYLDVFLRTQKALCGFSEVHVDKARLGLHIQTCPSGRREELLSFRTCSSPVYSRQTSTGRVTIVSGPRLLTLDKRYRRVIKSRFGEDGRVIQIDYVSLEPRVLLALTGQEAPDDVYSLLAQRIPGLDRSSLKTATMTVLYGGGVRRLSHHLRGKAEPGKVMDEIREVFHLRALEDRLKREFSETEMLTNHYGRILHPKRSDPGYLVATHVQSTAVDVALLGFNQARQAVSGISGIAPIGVVHDALWVDVHRDSMRYLEKMEEAATLVSGLDLRFPTSREDVNARSGSD